MDKDEFEGLLNAFGAMLDQKLDPMYERLDNLEQKVTGIEVTLENETNKKINFENICL